MGSNQLESTSNCPICGLLFYSYVLPNHITSCMMNFKGVHEPMLKTDFLQRSFEFSNRKTLKLKPKDITTVSDAIADARSFLEYSSEYSRIEFKHSGYYYVVVRLKKGE